MKWEALGEGVEMSDMILTYFFVVVVVLRLNYTGSWTFEETQIKKPLK